MDHIASTDREDYIFERGGNGQKIPITINDAKMIIDKKKHRLSYVTLYGEQYKLHSKDKIYHKDTLIS